MFCEVKEVKITFRNHSSFGTNHANLSSRVNYVSQTPLDKRRILIMGGSPATP